MTYAPIPSTATRKRLRMEERRERLAQRKERLNLWLETGAGQATLVGILLVVLLVGSRISGIVGN